MKGRVASALSAVLVLLAMVGCKPQQAAPPPVAPMAQAPTAADTPAAAPEEWGCLYSTADGVYWVGLEDAAKPVQIMPPAGEGEDDSGYDYAISPDGSRVALIGGDYRCEIIDLGTGERTEVWSADTDPGGMAWSPEGDKLAYTQGGVLSVRAGDGTKQTLVTDKFVSAVGWSPDGAQLAYGRRGEADKDLGMFLIPATGGKPRQLVKGTKEVYGVADITWSPDGKWIAFTHSYEGGAVCFVKPDGTAYRSDVDACFSPLIWLQDSSAVVYQAMENEMETRGVHRCAPTGKPQPILVGKNVGFDMLPSGRVLAASNAPEGQSGPVKVRLLTAPKSGLQPEWSQSIAASYVSGKLQPNGEHLALQVQQNHQVDSSLWIAASGQDATRRVEKIRSLMAWTKRPGPAFEATSEAEDTQ